MDNLQSYVEFFLNGEASVIDLETLEISHPSFARVYYLVRNATAGITVTHEDGLEYFHQYFPLRLEHGGAGDDLDYGIEVNLGDLNEIIGPELARVYERDDYLTKPQIIYRSYRSDDLTRPMNGPYRLEVKDISSSAEGSSFRAGAASLNLNQTGRVYSYELFPGLRGFL